MLPAGGDPRDGLELGFQLGNRPGRVDAAFGAELGCLVAVFAGGGGDGDLEWNVRGRGGVCHCHAWLPR